MKRLLFFLAVATMPSGIFAQATIIYTRGMLNAASFMQAGLPAGSIARGSLFTIFGRGMGPSSSPSLAFPLSTNSGRRGGPGDPRKHQRRGHPGVRQPNSDQRDHAFQRAAGRSIGPGHVREFKDPASTRDRRHRQLWSILAEQQRHRTGRDAELRRRRQHAA